MKSYISSGKGEIKNLEAEAMDNQPPLFHDYASASATEKTIMDAQLRDLKTNARFQSKAGWHNWRSQLLNDLKSGLLQTSKDLDQDDKMISQVESSIAGILPDMLHKEAELQDELNKLEHRKQNLEENSGDEVQQARNDLLAVDAELAEKKALYESLQLTFREQQSSLEDAQSWKEETTAAIAEADRITEEYRGWSVSEVSTLQDQLSSLEQKNGWSLVSASGTSITISHDNLHLTFHPRSWITNSYTPHPEAPNSPVSLICVGPEQDYQHPNATVRRFFLQLLRAHVFSLPQCRTRASVLLATIRSGWDLASRVNAALGALTLGGVTDASIEGDERMALQFVLLLPSLTTKVHVRFAIHVSILDAVVQGRVSVSAKVVYGEKYDEVKMAEFLTQFVGGHVGNEEEVRRWADGVEDLRIRLLRRGRKGTS
jgi:kinetochore protein Spc7/SPC105